MQITVVDVKRRLDVLQKYLQSPLWEVLEKCKPDGRDDDTGLVLLELKPHMTRTLHDFMCDVVENAVIDSSDLCNMSFIEINPFRVLLEVYGSLSVHD